MSDLEILEELKKGGVDLESHLNHYCLNEYNKITDIIFSDIIFKYERYDLLELICELNELRFLTLHNCNVERIPNNISNLKYLIELDLKNNKIQKIPYSLFSSFSLEVLDLSFNEIKGFNDFSLDLIKLNLSNNQIEFLPDNIALFESLKVLNLNNNNIKWIPEDLINLKANIGLYNNPISKNLLLETKHFQQSNFIQYLLSIQEDGEPLNEAKILVLGDERVGKTSIINKLLDKDFEENQTTTEGIDIENYYLSNEVKINIWDFAGQEITHQTHQFFLSTRSLYLFVLDAQKEDNDSAIYDWLETIKINSVNSPIIIVVNKFDLNKGYTFDINRYQKDFPNIRNVIYTSAKNNINIEQLEESIEINIETLKNTRAIFNKNWLTVKTELEMLSYNENIDYIEGGKFNEICEANSIDEELDQQTLLTILHEIGTIVRYENSKLNSVQIINPLWITNAVYKIIRSEFLNKDSILHKNTFYKIFKDDKRYKQRHYKWIMDLLVQFELAFRLDENRVLIPLKLPNNEPNFDKTPFQQGLNLRHKYEGRLQKSAISQFMVKMSGEIDMSLETPYWQRGVFLKYGNCKAVVISEEEKKTITISIDTEDIQGREFLSNIRREFKKINKSIEVEEEIPLILDRKLVGYADYENLVWAEKKGYKNLPYRVKVDGKLKSHEFKVSVLLYGYEIVDESEIIDITPLIITEGKTDKTILEIAWKKLYDKRIPFEIQSSGVEIDEEKREGSADSVKRTIELMSGIFDKDRVLIGLFDNDMEGNNNFKGLTKKAFEKYNISLQQRKHLSKNIYALLLPTPEFRKIFVSEDDIGQRMFVIEHYFTNEVLQRHQMKGKPLLSHPR